jgi:hypothetical protein
VPGTVAADYLAARRCALPHPEGDLRWHPEVRHPSGHVGPALLALVTDAVTCEPLTLHRARRRRCSQPGCCGPACRKRAALSACGLTTR